MKVSRLRSNEEDEAETSSPRVLRYDGDNNQSGTGDVDSQLVDWNQNVGEERLGFKLIGGERGSIVADRKQGMSNKQDEGAINNTGRAIEQD